MFTKQSANKVNYWEIVVVVIKSYLNLLWSCLEEQSLPLLMRLILFRPLNV